MPHFLIHVGVYVGPCRCLGINHECLGVSMSTLDCVFSVTNCICLTSIHVNCMCSVNDTKCKLALFVIACDSLTIIG